MRTRVPLGRRKRELLPMPQPVRCITPLRGARRGAAEGGASVDDLKASTRSSSRMQFAAVGMATSSQQREEERLRHEREKGRQQAQFLQRTFGLPPEEVPLEDFSCALQVRRPSAPCMPRSDPTPSFGPG